MAAFESRCQLSSFPMAILRLEHLKCSISSCFVVGKSMKCLGCSSSLPLVISDQILETSFIRTQSLPILSDDSWRLFVLPSSLLIGPVTPFSLVIKPTLSEFCNYSRKSLLHIGLSDASGRFVYNFDERGISIETWSGALCVSLSDFVSPLRLPVWNTYLESHVKSERIRVKEKTRYHSITNNCYDFVIRFLNSIDSRQITKEDVVMNLIAEPLHNFEIFHRWYTDMFQVGSTLHLPPDLSSPISSAGNISSSSLKHSSESWSCDGCDTLYVDCGDRYHCNVCPDYDLCPTCFASVKFIHDVSHQFDKMSS